MTILRTLYLARVARERMGKAIAVPVGPKCSMAGLVREVTWLGLTIETCDGMLICRPWANIDHLAYNDRLERELAEAREQDVAEVPKPALSPEEIAAMMAKADGIKAEVAVRR